LNLDLNIEDFTVAPIQTDIVTERRHAGSCNATVFDIDLMDNVKYMCLLVQKLEHFSLKDGLWHSNKISLILSTNQKQLHPLHKYLDQIYSGENMVLKSITNKAF
jgi:hypothetical protein